MCSLRPVLGWLTLRRLKRVGVSAASEDVLASLARVSRRLRLRRSVQVLESRLAQVPLVVGYVRPVILLPLIGAKLSLVIVAGSYLLLLPDWSKKNLLLASIPVVFSTAFLLWPQPMRFISLPPASEVVTYREGVMASVAVVKDAAKHKYLKVNNHFTMGGTASRYSDYRQTHIPLLLHGDPKSALYLGLGTGITFQAAKYYPKLLATGVELLPEALDFLSHFGVNPQDVSWRKRPQLLAADARRFIVADSNSYDVIIAEIFHPSRDGAGSLYTREHFSLIRERLNPGGMFCQWLPLFQLDLPTLKLIIRTFISVFPHAQLHLGHFSLKQPILCLLGSNDNKTYSNNWLLKRVHDSSLQQQLVSLRLNSDYALFGGYLAGSKQLKALVGEGPINTDDRPLVTYRAPQFVYSIQQPAATRTLVSGATGGAERKTDDARPDDQLYCP